MVVTAGMPSALGFLDSKQPWRVEEPEALLAPLGAVYDRARGDEGGMVGVLSQRPPWRPAGQHLGIGAVDHQLAIRVAALREGEVGREDCVVAEQGAEVAVAAVVSRLAAVQRRFQLLTKHLRRVASRLLDQR